MSSPAITVITPWLNHREYTRGYLDALEDAGADDWIVVDNGSKPPIKFANIRFDENRGFHAACNAGLHAATTDAVLFLNNDIELQTPGWLNPIREQLDYGKLVGQVRVEAHTRVDGEYFPYVDGWCLAAMRQDLLELGGWDETLAEPAYYGDNLLSLKAVQAGMTLVHIGHIGLRHLNNGTTRDDIGRASRAAATNRLIWQQEVREARQPAVA